MLAAATLNCDSAHLAVALHALDSVKDVNDSYLDVAKWSATDDTKDRVAWVLDKGRDSCSQLWRQAAAAARWGLIGVVMPLGLMPAAVSTQALRLAIRRLFKVPTARHSHGTAQLRCTPAFLPSSFTSRYGVLCLPCHICRPSSSVGGHARLIVDLPRRPGRVVLPMVGGQAPGRRTTWRPHMAGGGEGREAAAAEGGLVLGSGGTCRWMHWLGVRSGGERGVEHC